MCPKTRDLLLLLGAPALIAGVLVLLIFGAIKLAHGATLNILTDTPCKMNAAGDTLDCRAVQPTPPPPPPPPVGNCSAFPTVLRQTWLWSAGNRTIDTAALGGIGQGILVVEFVPTTPAQVDVLGKASAVEYPGTAQVTTRTLAISTVPCDLVGLPPGPASSTAPQLGFGVGTVTNSLFSGKPKGVALVPGQRYFINLHAPGCTPSGAATCDARLTLFKPAGH
jgi:hypothetical protein